MDAVYLSGSVKDCIPLSVKVAIASKGHPKLRSGEANFKMSAKPTHGLGLAFVMPLTDDHTSGRPSCKLHRAQAKAMLYTDLPA
jgi:hypothetical protein